MILILSGRSRLDCHFVIPLPARAPAGGLTGSARLLSGRAAFPSNFIRLAFRAQPSRAVPFCLTSPRAEPAGFSPPGRLIFQKTRRGLPRSGP